MNYKEHRKKLLSNSKARSSKLEAGRKG